VVALSFLLMYRVIPLPSTKICPNDVLVAALSGNTAPDGVRVEPVDGTDVACAVGALVGAVAGVVEVDKTVVGWELTCRIVYDSEGRAGKEKGSHNRL